MINFYELSIANIPGVNMVIDHCKDRLQGYKYHQMVEFIYTSKSLMAFSCFFRRKKLEKASRINEFVFLYIKCVMLSNHCEKVSILFRYNIIILLC